MNTFILLAMLCQPVAGDPPIERRPSTAIEGLININLNLSLINAKFDSLAEQWKRTNDILDKRAEKATEAFTAKAAELVSLKDASAIVVPSIIAGLIGVLIGGMRKDGGK